MNTETDRTPGQKKPVQEDMARAGNIDRSLRCKRCAMPLIRPSRNEGAYEWVLQRFSFQPFRCQLCTYRFYRRKPNGRGPTMRTDKREYLRLPVTFPIIFSGKHLEGEGMALNLSIHGCAMETNTRPVIGSIVSLVLQTEEYRPPIRIDRAVVRSGLGMRFGLEFIKVHVEDVERLRQVYYKQATAKTST